MRNWFRRVGKTSREQHSSRPRFFRPTLEGLEERSLLDAGMAGFTLGAHEAVPPSAMMMTMSSPMMMPSDGMMQAANAAMMQARVDAFFHMLDSRLISVETAIVARWPQLEGMVQSFNAMMTAQESAIAGHPINDLIGQV